ncbi:KxYKxGKxW signal peptide domain-containing protein [Levilactobacillus brevis]
MGEKKLHYKMYKDGKKFVFAAIATFSINDNQLTCSVAKQRFHVGFLFCFHSTIYEANFTPKPRHVKALNEN